MKKLKLDLNDLKVESFKISPSIKKESGTVQAYEKELSALNPESGCPGTCIHTCAVTCFNSCDISICTGAAIC